MTILGGMGGPTVDLPIMTPGRLLAAFGGFILTGFGVVVTVRTVFIEGLELGMGRGLAVGGLDDWLLVGVSLLASIALAVTGFLVMRGARGLHRMVGETVDNEPSLRRKGWAALALVVMLIAPMILIVILIVSMTADAATIEGSWLGTPLRLLDVMIIAVVLCAALLIAARLVWSWAPWGPREPRD